MKEFKVYLAEEAIDLRWSLFIMMAVHLFYLVVMPTSKYTMLVDAALLTTAFKASVKLNKPLVILYLALLFLFFAVGLTHTKFFTTRFAFRVLSKVEKKEGLYQIIFLFQCFFYLGSAYQVGQKLKSHMIVQEAIRISNYNREVKGRVKLRLRDALSPKIAKLLKERF